VEAQPGRVIVQGRKIMIRQSHRFPQLIVLTGALVLTTVASAALKDKPPKDVTLHGTAWKIDQYSSDDPAEVIDKASKDDEAAEIAKRASGRDRGVFDDGRTSDDGPLGGGMGRRNDDGSWGGTGGYRDRTGRRIDPNDPMPMPDSSGGATWGRSGRSSTDIDPTGQSSSATIAYGGGPGGIRNEFVTQLTSNPDTLSFLQVNDHLKITADKLETDCAAGSKEPISDSFGDGERRCGWEGRAFVVETKRGRIFTRTDRYELSKDGKSLSYSTIATGRNMPKIRISRTYRVAPPAPPPDA
jgi:hypothetical protein